MKRKLILISFMFLFISQFSFAGDYPLDKGSLMYSGNFSFSSKGGDLYAYDSGRLLSIQTNPSVNYFLISGLSLGIDGAFTYVSQDDFSTTNWGLGASANYYFNGGLKPNMPIKQPRYPFPYITFSYMYSDFSNSNPSQSSISLGLGLLGLADDYAGINLEISYEMVDPFADSKGSKLNFTIGFNLFQY